MVPPTAVFVVIPHLALASLIREILLCEPGIRIVGEAAGLYAAASALALCKPDLVLLDSSLPDASGLEAIAQLAKAVPNARFVLLCDDDDKRYRAAAAKRGATCVRKDRVVTDLIASLWDIQDPCTSPPGPHSNERG